MTRNFRLTAIQAQLLYVGLRPIWVSYYNHKQNGSLLNAHPDHLNLSFRNRRGKYSSAFMQKIVRLWHVVGPMKDSGGRIYKLDYVDVSVCILAIRIASQQIRHGHLQRWSNRLDRSSRYLLRKLEAVQRSLKRDICAAQGHAAFRDLSLQWRQFVRWLRLHFLFCSCMRRLPNPVYRMRVKFAATFCEWTSAELVARSEPVPSDHDLRKLVRRHLRNVRRGLTPYAVRHLWQDRPFAASRFANYIVNSSN